MFTYSLMLQEYLAWSFSQTAQLETSMVSMERCLKYTSIKGEKPSIMENDNNLIKRNCPEEGNIKFFNYSAKYRINSEILELLEEQVQVKVQYVYVYLEF